MSKSQSQHGSNCKCERCECLLAAAERHYAEGEDLRNVPAEVRPFLLRVRHREQYHAWGKNAPGGAPTIKMSDDCDPSPWNENNVRILEDGE